MAPYFNDLLDEEEDKNATNFQVSGASPTTDQSGQIVQGAQTGGGGKGPSTGSGYQNLDKYLNANAGQNFGQEFVGKVQDQVTGAESAFDEAGQKFKDQVTGANNMPSQDQINDAIENPGNMSPEEFQKWMKQTYAGYNNLAESPEAYNQYWGEANKAKTSAGLMGSEAGRFSLLDSYYGRPSYSFGNKSLDNMLVQRGGVGNQMNAIQNQASLLQTQGKNQADQLSDFAATQKAAVENSAKNVNDAYNQAVGGVTGSIEEQLAALNNQRSGDYNSLMQNLGGVTGPNLTPAQLEMLGLTNDTELYRLTPDQLKGYVSGNDPLVKEQIATPEQKARLQALNQLAGTEQSYLGDLKEKTDTFNINKTGFQNALAAEKLAYEKALVDAQPKREPFGLGVPGQEYLQQLWAEQAAAKAAVDKEFNIGRKIGPKTYVR